MRRRIGLSVFANNQRATEPQEGAFIIATNPILRQAPEKHDVLVGTLP